jgi:hypothetical protein
LTGFTGKQQAKGKTGANLGVDSVVNAVAKNYVFSWFQSVPKGHEMDSKKAARIGAG